MTYSVRESASDEDLYEVAKTTLAEYEIIYVLARKPDDNKLSTVLVGMANGSGPLLSEVYFDDIESVFAKSPVWAAEAGAA